MTDKIRVGVVFGGRSAEHQVSLQSAKNVIDAIDKTKYEVVPIGIAPDGRWLIEDESAYLLDSDDPKRISLLDSGEDVAFLPVPGQRQVVPMTNGNAPQGVDVVFPVMHGTYGEDGAIQGLMRLADIPFVGAGIAGSAVGMDKDLMKRLLRDGGLPVGKFVTLRAGGTIDAAKIFDEVGIPCFVKPANMGSSVGITKVHDEKEFGPAVEEAFEYDRKVLVEEFIEGREIECAVLGNEDPEASVPGEIVPHDEFYSYNAKYIDENGAALDIPAKLTEEETARVRELSVAVFKCLSCEGMARVDFFLHPERGFVVNEINTIPGFTRISMYPKLWGATGVPYGELIHRLIQLAIERHEKERGLKTTYEIRP